MVVTIYENVAFFFDSKKMDGTKIFCKKSLKNGLEITETISRNRAKFYRDVAFFMADTVISKCTQFHSVHFVCTVSFFVLD